MMTMDMFLELRAGPIPINADFTPTSDHFIAVCRLCDCPRGSLKLCGEALRLGEAHGSGRLNSARPARRLRLVAPLMSPYRSARRARCRSASLWLGWRYKAFR